MALLPILSNSPEQVYGLSIQQIVAICGNGKLVDQSNCSEELRLFLGQAPSEKLIEYAGVCLSDGFEKSGQVLQDIVNELGRRLDYKVENGLYSGKANAIGFDGLWQTEEEKSIVVEVKTTDIYRINLDTIATYKERLISAGKIGSGSSILIVVGRQDTGDLEAQVRGSRHAWDVRLISVEALTKLVRLKETAEEATVAKIRELLTPFEYTKVDRIIDIAFTAAQEVSEGRELEEGFASDGSAPDSAEKMPISYTQNHTPRDIINNVRSRIISNIAALEKKALIRKSAALYWSSDAAHELRVVCTISKRYDKNESNYWYAYHPAWDSFLYGGAKGFFVLGCVDRGEAFALPYSWIKLRLPELYVTEKEEKRYWHIVLAETNDGELEFRTMTGRRYSIAEFKISGE